MAESIEEEIQEKGYIIYNNVGTSMMPLIRQKRDLLVIEKAPAKCKKYDVVLYKSNGKLILHRIIKVNEKDYVIRGDNCTYKEYGIKDKDIIGILSSVERDGKTFDMRSAKMKAYSHYVVDFYAIKAGMIFGKRVLSKIKRTIIKK